MKLRSIRVKILALTIGSVVMTAAAMLSTVIWQRSGLRDHVKDSLITVLNGSSGETVKGVYRMCEAFEGRTQRRLEHSLKIARDRLVQAGEVSFGEPVAWKAVNQLTHEPRELNLPKLLVAGQWLGQNHDPKTESAVVDWVRYATEDSCTVFQRIDDGGDMLRVATTVTDADGKRAIGTFIPRRQPDGADNPVVAAVLKGQTYHGRVNVMNRWYATSYEPIWDSVKKDKVIGMLYVGVAMDDVAREVRESVMATTVGKTGYVYVLQGKGEQRGSYVISKDGKRDGENIWTAKDSNGHLFIQSITEKALSTRQGSTAIEHYPWKNQGETSARVKVAVLTYYEPWDWVIAAGTYEDDYSDVLAASVALIDKMVVFVAIGAAILSAVFLVLSYVVTRGIVGPLQKSVRFAESVAGGDLTQRLAIKQQDEVGDLVNALNRMAEKLETVMRNVAQNATTLIRSSAQLSATSSLLASGAEETTAQSAAVAASAEEMSTNMSTMATSTDAMSANVKTVAAAVEEMTASISEVARNAEQAAGVADDAARLAQTSTDQIGQLGDAADQIGKVIEVIQDIAEQTNLLALNATIEAARAGDAGKGFAVVATEVKELAKQTAGATEDIRKRIHGIQSATSAAIQSIRETSRVIKNVNEVSRTIAAAVEEQSITTREIAQNVAQTASASSVVSHGVAESAIAGQEITRNITGVDTAARQTAEGAAETQTAGSELSKLAEELMSTVSQFRLSQNRFEPGPYQFAHESWKKKLAEVLSGKSSLKASEVVDHHHCKLGEWYDAEGTRECSQLAVFKTLGEEHARFHALAREVTELSNERQWAEARERYQQFTAQSGKVVTLLDQLGREVNGGAAPVA